MRLTSSPKLNDHAEAIELRQAWPASSPRLRNSAAARARGRERPIGLVVVAAAAGGIDEIVQALGDRGIEDVAASPRTPRSRRRRALPTTDSCNSRPNSRRRRYAGNAACGGASRSPPACRSARAPPARRRRRRRRRGVGSRCSSRSTSAEAVYSTVAKPWLNRRAREQLVEQRLRHRLAGLGSGARSGAASPAARASARRAARETRRNRRRHAVPEMRG